MVDGMVRYRVGASQGAFSMRNTLRRKRKDGTIMTAIFISIIIIDLSGLMV